MPVPVVLHRAVLLGPQVARIGAHDADEMLRIAHIVGAEIEAHPHPFVRIEDQGIGALDARPVCAAFGQYHRGSGHGGVHMQPHPMAFREVRHLGQRVHGRRGGGANAGHKRAGAPPVLHILGDSRLQKVQPQRVIVIGGDEPQIVPAKARQKRALFDAAVALVRGVDRERGRSRLQAGAVLAESGGPLPGAKQRREGGGAGGVMHHAGPGFAQARHLAEPVHDHLLQLRGGGARLPAHALHAQPRGHDIREDRSVARVAWEVGEEARVVPMRDAGHDILAKRVQGLGQPPALLGRMRRKRRPDLAGLYLAHDRPAASPSR